MTSTYRTAQGDIQISSVLCMNSTYITIGTGY